MLRVSEIHVTQREVQVPVAKAMPRQVVKPVMASTSSKLPAAINSVGTPCSAPYPSFCSSSMEGTTTAGDTAPRTNLNTPTHAQHGESVIVHLFYSFIYVMN